MSAGPVQWPGGEHCFALPLGQLRALQTALDSGPEEVLNRLRFGTWRVDDLIEVLRLGLIGAEEMGAKEAGPFVTGLFERHPVVEFKMAALTVLAGALLGVEDDPVGKPEGPAPAQESGVSAASTDPAP